MKKSFILCYIICCQVRCQDLPSIYGKLSLSTQALTNVELDAVATKCFSGLHLKTCKSVVPTDDTVYDYESQYYKITLASSPQAYCLQCCGLNPQRVDNWHLRCAMDVFTASTSNLYGYEFRMGTQKTLGGYDFISCPLKRRACSYSQNGILIACNPTEKYYLHGYELNLNIVRYTSNFQSWRGISSCLATAIESNITLSSGDIFTETIHMTWDQAPFQSTQPVSLAFFSFFGVLCIYFILLFTRRKHCPICQKKLLLCPNRCYVCLFLGADVPDPVLTLALEAKERRILRGELSPNPTVLSSAITIIKDSFQYMYGATSCCCYGLKKSSPIHTLGKENILSESDRSSKKGGTNVFLSDLELEKYRPDSSEQRFNQRSQKDLSYDPQVCELDPPEASVFKPSVWERFTFGEVLRSLRSRRAAVAAVAVSGDLDVTNSHPLSKLVTIDSTFTVEVPKGKRKIRRLYGSERNQRILLFSKESIVKAVDDEYVTKKPTGVTKNKFTTRCVVRIIETLA